LFDFIKNFSKGFFFLIISSLWSLSQEIHLNWKKKNLISLLRKKKFFICMNASWESENGACVIIIGNYNFQVWNTRICRKNGFISSENSKFQNLSSFSKTFIGDFKLKKNDLWFFFKTKMRSHVFSKRLPMLNSI